MQRRNNYVTRIQSFREIDVCVWTLLQYNFCKVFLTEFHQMIQSKVCRLFIKKKIKKIRQKIHPVQSFHRDYYFKDKNNIFQMTVVESRGSSFASHANEMSTRGSRIYLSFLSLSIYLSLSFSRMRTFVCVCICVSTSQLLILRNDASFHGVFYDS